MYIICILFSEGVFLVQIVIRVLTCVIFFHVCTGLQLTLFCAWESTDEALTLWKLTDFRTFARDEL